MQTRIVPDFISLFPGAGKARRLPAPRGRCAIARKSRWRDQMSVLAKFYVFSSTHVAGHFTGMITNDFASEFDPFSPQFGEKFARAQLAGGDQGFRRKRNLAASIPTSGASTTV